MCMCVCVCVKGVLNQVLYLYFFIRNAFFSAEFGSLNRFLLYRSGMTIKVANKCPYNYDMIKSLF